MLRVVAQQASRVVRAPALARGFALEGTKFSEGEKAIEDLYFTKEDQRLMAKLMAKVRKASIIVGSLAGQRHCYPGRRILLIPY